MPRSNEAELLPAGTTSAARRLIFHPFVVLLISIGGALIYAVWITWRFGGRNLENQYVYVVPIVVPFVSFLLDRVEQIQRLSIAGLAVDFLLVGTSLMRVIGNVPFVSGHTLFLAYAIIGPASRVTRITAALVMVEVIYLKYFVWHDPITSTNGIMLGTLAALIAHRFARRFESTRERSRMAA